MTNFSSETRFDFGEQEVISRLLTGPAAAGHHPRALKQALRDALSGRGERRAALARVAHQPFRRRQRWSTFSDFCGLVEQLTDQSLEFAREDGFFRLTHGSDSWIYPAASEKLMFFAFLTAVDPARWLRAKYSLPGFVEVEPGDVVVDCGAFVGGFARAAARADASVIAVEPSRTNRRCLEMNVNGDVVDIRPVGLGAQNYRVPFRESSTGLDSSFGELDEGFPTTSYDVDVLTVDELCRDSGIEPTFLKVEAEGMESAILQGMNEVRPAKIAVDASPEGGSDDRRAIALRLSALGYRVRTDLNMIYARRPT